MSRYNPYYYLLFVLLIFGAFASMAQNDYGIQILGFVALAFGVIFLLQFIFAIRKKRVDAVAATELGSLVVLSAVLFMRVFYIRFPFVEVLFGAAGALLVSGYLIKLVASWNALKAKSKPMGMLLMLFFGSIISYAISMTSVPFASTLAEPAGALGFGLLVIFLIAALLKGEMLVEGERLSAFGFVARLKDRSIVLATLFLLFTAYMGLTRIDVLPKMYMDQFPQAYYELVNRVESGSDSPENSRRRYEEFKKQYDRFAERHLQSK
jgi:putative exporter of polyketide antibiotics